MASSDERGTPHYIVQAAREVMGGIDLDPASCAAANEVVVASCYYTKEDDGLTKPWRGRIFLNPPYSRGLCTKFIQKLDLCYKWQDIQAVVIVNVSTAKWYHALLANYPVVFPRHHEYHTNARVEFYPLPGNDRGINNNSTGQAIFYLGPYVQRFYRVFGEFCTVPKGESP